MKIKRGSLLFILLFVMVVIGLIAVVAVSKFGIGKSGTGNLKNTDAEDSQVRQLQTFSDSDEVDAIEKDLGETNLDSINQELPQLDEELKSL